MARKDEQPIRCSFCGKRESQASRLIAGPGVYICSDCVAACSELLREELRMDRGGAEVLRRERIPCDIVQAAYPWELWDVDTPEAMERARAVFRAGHL